MTCERNEFCNCDGSCRPFQIKPWQRELVDALLKNVASGRKLVITFPPLRVRDFERIADQIQKENKK